MTHLIYIDPGSGSYLVQVIVAGALGIIFFFKNIMTRIRHFFIFLKFRKSKRTDGEEGN